MAFKTQADLDEALRVGTVAKEDAVVEGVIEVTLFPQTDEEVADLFKSMPEAPEFTGKSLLSDDQLAALEAGGAQHSEDDEKVGFFKKLLG